MRTTGYLAIALVAVAGGAFTLAGCDAADPAADAGLTAAARPDGAGMARVAVCHYDADADAYKLIVIAEPAVAAHLAQGGALPGTNGLDEACQPVASAATCPCSYAALTEANFIDEWGYTDDDLNIRLTYLFGSTGSGRVRYDTSFGGACMTSDVDEDAFEHKTFSSVAEAEACRLVLYDLNTGSAGLGICNTEESDTGELCGVSYFVTFGG
jgi:hypothetical protein